MRNTCSWQSARFKTMLVLGFGLILLLNLAALPTCWAASARELDVRVDDTLQKFYKEVKNGSGLVKKARGVLVMPKVYKAGIGIGGEYGQGALRIGGKTVDYYSITAASIGFQLGGQRKSIILLFMDEAALHKFQSSSGWEVGVDASVTLINVGADAEDKISSKTYNQPILAFVIGQRGLMYDASLEGAKFSKLDK